MEGPSESALVASSHADAAARGHPVHTAYRNEMVAMRILARQVKNGVMATLFQQMVWKAHSTEAQTDNVHETLFRPGKDGSVSKFIHDNAVKEWDAVYAVRGQSHDTA